MRARGLRGAGGVPLFRPTGNAGDRRYPTPAPGCFALTQSSRNPHMAVTYRIAPDERIVYLTTTGDATFARWREAVLSALSEMARMFSTFAEGTCF